MVNGAREAEDDDDGWGLSGKRFVVTGANRGIGLALAMTLAQRGADVLVTARTKDKAIAAIQSIAEERGADVASHVCVVIADFSTLDSTEAACASLQATLKGKHVDGLILNAGVWAKTCVINKDGIESSFMVNCVAPYAVSCALMPFLWATARRGQILIVGSLKYTEGEFALSETPYGKDFEFQRTYASTKQAQVMIARRLAALASGVDVNVVYPGSAATGLGIPRGLIFAAAFFCAQHFLKDASSAADAITYVATDPSLRGTSGKFFNKYKVDPALSWHAAAMDDAASDGLIELCRNLTGRLVPLKGTSGKYSALSSSFGSRGADGKERVSVVTSPVIRMAPEPPGSPQASGKAERADSAGSANSAVGVPCV